MTEAKVDLGRHLFLRHASVGQWDAVLCVLSRAGACVHRWTAAQRGLDGEVHPRGSMSLVNVAYARVLTWANPKLERLEDQALVPMYGDHLVSISSAAA